MTIDRNDADNNNSSSSTSDDLIDIDGGNAGAPTFSDGANGDGTASDGTVSEAMVPATPVLSGSPTGPVLSGANNSVDYLPGSAPVAVDPKLGVSDAQSTTLAGATVAISAGFFTGDTLNFNSQNGIFGSYNASTGVLTLTGTASLANYQAALESITYGSTNINPTDAGTDVNRTVSWTVTDGTQTSNTITSALIVGLLDGVEGAFAVYDFRNNNVISVENPGQLGLIWQVAGVGDFSGNANETDLLVRNSSTGAFQVYDISHNTIISTGPLGAVGLEWTVAGFGNFSGNANETDILLRNSNTGAFEVYDVNHNVITSAGQVGSVGLEWTVAGVGDFSTNPNETDMLLRNNNTGAFEVYDIVNNAITSIGSLGTVGLEWTIAGFGDFSGNANETDMMLRNSNTGAFELYDISNNQITGAVPMGQVGLAWTVAGFGDFSGNANETDMLVRDSNNGALEVFDISHNALTSVVPIGAIGLEWAVSGFGDFSSTPGETDMLMRDTTVESATIIPPLGPLGASAAAAAMFVVTGDLDPDFTGSLTLTDGTFSTALPYTGNGAYTANLETWPNGQVTASLAVVDTYNNSFTTSTMVAIDTDYGETVGLSGPAGTLGSSAAAAAKFVVTGNLDANYTGSLTLTDGASSTALAYTGDGTYKANLETWADGTVAATLTVSDPAGNSFTASTTAAIDPDYGETVMLAVSPATVIIGFEIATFTISGLDAGDTGAGNTATLVLSELLQPNETFSFTPTATSGTYTETLGFLVPGLATAFMTLTDAAGNTFTATAGLGLEIELTENKTLMQSAFNIDNGPAGIAGSPVGGSGGAEISGGATVEFGAASSANVSFAAGAAGMLKLDQSSGFSGTVAGFGAGDAIDLADIVFGGSDTLAYAANAGGTGGVLSVSDGTHAANLALIGQYAAAEFATAPDPGGGTVVTYGQAPPASGSTDQALFAHPHH